MAVDQYNTYGDGSKPLPLRNRSRSRLNGIHTRIHIVILELILNQNRSLAARDLPSCIETLRRLSAEGRTIVKRTHSAFSSEDQDGLVVHYHSGNVQAEIPKTTALHGNYFIDSSQILPVTVRTFFLIALPYVTTFVSMH